MQQNTPDVPLRERLFPSATQPFMLDDLKRTLWATADKLRANVDAAEHRHLVLGLIFLKYSGQLRPPDTAEAVANARAWVQHNTSQ